MPDENFHSFSFVDAPKTFLTLILLVPANGTKILVLFPLILRGLSFVTASMRGLLTSVVVLAAALAAPLASHLDYETCVLD